MKKDRFVFLIVEDQKMRDILAQISPRYYGFVTPDGHPSESASRHALAPRANAADSVRLEQNKYHLIDAYLCKSILEALEIVKTPDKTEEIDLAIVDCNLHIGGDERTLEKAVGANVPDVVRDPENPYSILVGGLYVARFLVNETEQVIHRTCRCHHSSSPIDLLL